MNPSGSWKRMSRPSVLLGAAASMLVVCLSAAQVSQRGSPASPGTSAELIPREICAEKIEDQAGLACITASSTPALGSLYPLSSALFVSPAGDIGFGTITPDFDLDVNSGTIGNVFKVESGPGTAQSLRLFAKGGMNFVVDSNDDDASGDFRWYNNGEAAANRVMTLTDEGNLGIAVNPPTARLHVAGDVLVTNATTGRALDVRNTSAASIGQTLNIERTADATAGNDFLQIMGTASSSIGAQFIECEYGAGDVRFRVDGDGDVFADGAFGAPADFAEMIAVSAGAHTVEPGDVVVIDPARPRSIAKATVARSSLVAGIYSTNPGFLGSERPWEREADPGTPEFAAREPLALKPADMTRLYDEVPVAVIGIVPCKASTENGAILPGDLLVTSSLPGHAMRDLDPRAGTIVGKALEPLQRGTGTIRVLVTLQ